MNPPGGEWPYPGSTPGGLSIPWSEAPEARNGNSMVRFYQKFSSLKTRLYGIIHSEVNFLSIP